MDSSSGDIREMEKWNELLKGKDEKLNALVPFDEGEGEIVEIKGCRFKLLNVKCHPENTIRLRGIPIK